MDWIVAFLLCTCSFHLQLTQYFELTHIYLSLDTADLPVPIKHNKHKSTDNMTVTRRNEDVGFQAFCRKAILWISRRSLFLFKSQFHVYFMCSDLISFYKSMVAEGLLYHLHITYILYSKACESWVTAVKKLEKAECEGSSMYE